MRWRYLLAPEGSSGPGFDRVVAELDGLALTTRLVKDPAAHRVLTRRTQRRIGTWIRRHPPTRRAS